MWEVFPVRRSPGERAELNHEANLCKFFRSTIFTVGIQWMAPESECLSVFKRAFPFWEGEGVRVKKGGK